MNTSKRTGPSLVNDAAGWAVFAVITVASIGPTILLISPPAEVVCWQEKRLTNENYKPRTILRPVCEVRGWTH